MSTPDIKHVKVERIVVLADSSIVIHHTGGGEYVVRFGDLRWLAMDEYLCPTYQSEDFGICVGPNAYVWLTYAEVRDAMKAARGMREAAAAEQASEPVDGVGAFWTHITADPEANVEVACSNGVILTLRQLALFHVMFAASGEDPLVTGVELHDEHDVALTVEDCERVVTLIREAIVSGQKRHLVRVL